MTFFFFCSSLDLGQKTDVMPFKEPVLLLRIENISGPAGMTLNCGPAPLLPPSNSWARPSGAMPTVSANPSYASVEMASNYAQH